MSNIGKLLVCMTLAACLIAVYVEGYPFWKGTKFHVIIMNWVTSPPSILEANCVFPDPDKNYTEYSRIGVANNMTWSFETLLFVTTNYTCDLIKDYGKITFTAFLEDKDFVDNGCGGRHCIWNATEDGLYLYHIQKRQFFLKYKWAPNSNSNSISV